MYNPNAPTEVFEHQPGKKPLNKTIIIVAAAVVVIILCCCLAAAAVVIVDPFQWDLLGRLSGKADMAAQAMPEDTPLYVGVNLVNFNPVKVNKIMKPFLEASGEFDENDTQGLIEKMDQQLDDEIGMTITEDVIPWIGQYVGIGFTSLDFNAEYGDIEEAKFVIIAEARDKKKADEFITKLTKVIEDESGSDFGTSEYKGVTLYTLDDDYSPFSICRSGSLVLIGYPEESVRESIDAQKGENLRSNPNFKTMTSKLPGERGVTFYINGDAMKDIGDALSSDLGDAGDQVLNQSSLEAWQDSAISLSLVDAGIQLDVASSYDLEKLSDTDKEMLSGKGGIPDSVNKLPADTIMYIAGKQLNLIWKMYQDTIIGATGGIADYEESMNMLAETLGFHLEDDLLAYLDGDWAIALIPASDGMLQEELQVAVGAVGLFGTSNEPEIKTTVGYFTENIQKMGLEPDNLSKGDYQLYEIIDPMSGKPMVAYGVGLKYMALGTSGEILTNIFEGTTPLSKDSGHSDVWKAFPGNSIPVMYLNVQEGINLLLGSLDEYSLESFSEAEPYIKPITFIAMGTSPLDNNISRSTLIIFVDQD